MREHHRRTIFNLCNHTLFTQTMSFFLLPTRMYCLLYQFSCHCNSQLVGPTSPKRCRIKLNNKFPNLSPLALLPRNTFFQPVYANLPPSLIPSFRLHSIGNFFATRFEDFSTKNLSQSGYSYKARLACHSRVWRKSQNLKNISKQSSAHFFEIWDHSQ